jgi:hypothetical protein
MLLDQLFEAHQYYNMLIEIELRRRERFRAIRAEIVPELGALEGEHQILKDELQEGKDAIPRPKPINGKKQKWPPLPPHLVEIQTKMKALSGPMKEMRAKFNENAGAQERVKLLDAEEHANVIAARKASTAAWGTRGLIEAQVDQAISAACKHHKDPEFKPFQRRGRIGVQLQATKPKSVKGLTVAAALGCKDTRLQIVMAADPPTSDSRRASHHGHQVRIRIGSTVSETDKSKQPVWATLPLILHRPLPPDGLIKWAWIKVSNTGGQRSYDLQLAIESRSFDKFVPGRGTAAINFGWRANVEDGSRRVAYLVDDSGREQAFDVPESIQSTIDMADRVRSAKDLQLEAAKESVIKFAETHEVDEWFKEHTRSISWWRSSKKMAQLARHLSEAHLKESADENKSWRLEWTAARVAAKKDPIASYGEIVAWRWRLERLAAKKDLFASYGEIVAWFGKSDIVGLAFYLDLWRRKDQHLWQWEANARETATRRRKDLFRRWARKIDNTYAQVLIEDFKLPPMAKKPGPPGEVRPKQFRVARSTAAPGEFRARVVEVTGRKVDILPAHDNTVSCFACGYLNERALVHRMVCANDDCKAEWDQDANNCRNQLFGKATRSAAE